VISDLSVVIATYRSPGTLPELVARLTALPSWTPKSEIVIVDDGNHDNTWNVIQKLSTEVRSVRGFRLQQNVGQHAALLCGIRNVRNDLIITIDDDLQNPPEEIERLLAALETSVDLVVGIPKSASHNVFRRFTSKLSKVLLARSLGFKNASMISPFRLFRTRLRESFGPQLGRHISIDALLSLATNRCISVEVAHSTRKEGKSGYSMRKLVDFFLTTSTSASVVPLQIASRIGFVALMVSFSLLVLTVTRRLFFGSVITGFPFLASLVAGTSGVQLLLLGLLGQYIGHMHFRLIGVPSYVVLEATNDGRVH
jgi:glycosyltransferase involved in cell wall biosynthesis